MHIIKGSFGNLEHYSKRDSERGEVAFFYCKKLPLFCRKKFERFERFVIL